MNKNIVVEIKGLSKSFGSVQAVENLDLTIFEGEVFGLLGPNGAGKTTTLKMLLTLLRPTGGDARVLGYDIVTQAQEVRRVIGYVPQEKSVDRYMTGWEHLKLMAALYHLSGREAQDRIQETLDVVGLQEKAHDLVGDYSGGMKKKLDIACGLISSPRLMFMDEPSLGLDVESRLKIWEHIRQLKSQGITIVMSTNYLEEADELCDRLAIIDEGKIKAVGSPLELKKELGTDRVSIEMGDIASDAVQKLVEMIRSFEFVREIQRRDPVLEVWIQPGQENFSRLFEKVGNGQYPIQAIHYMRPSLEEVFVRHAGHGIRETEKS